MRFSDLQANVARLHARVHPPVVEETPTEGEPAESVEGAVEITSIEMDGLPLEVAVLADIVADQPLPDVVIETHTLSPAKSPRKARRAAAKG